jgi:hypothetical protein
LDSRSVKKAETKPPSKKTTSIPKGAKTSKPSALATQEASKETKSPKTAEASKPVEKMTDARSLAREEIARLREKKQTTASETKVSDKKGETGPKGSVASAGRFVVDLRSNSSGQN